MEPDNFAQRVSNLSGQLLKEVQDTLPPDSAVTYACAMISSAVATILRYAQEQA